MLLFVIVEGTDRPPIHNKDQVSKIQKAEVKAKQEEAYLTMMMSARKYRQTVQVVSSYRLNNCSHGKITLTPINQSSRKCSVH